MLDGVTQSINPLNKDSTICVEVFEKENMIDSSYFKEKNNLNKIFPSINSGSRK